MDYLDTILVNLFAGVYRAQGYIGVIIEEPPRHGKSELCSHYTPVWYLGARPDDRVILVSYESTFAETWGRKARDTMNEWGGPIFGLEVNQRSSAAARWDIKGHRGGMFTAGALGGITGKGANVLIADDLIKNQQDADSEVLRERIHTEWKSTYRSRLEPGGVILVVGTRWHEDDIIGRLLAEQGDSREGTAHALYNPEGDKYLRVRLPAIAEIPDEEFPEPDPLGRKPGEPLFQERFDVEALRPMMGTSTWTALYQQRPAPKEGAVLNPDWFEVVPHPGGKFKRMVRRWDLASTEKKHGEDPDWTVGLLLGEHSNGLYYILDIVRVRKNANGVEDTLKATRDRDGRKIRVRVEQEPGSQGKLYVNSLAKKIFKGYSFRGLKSTGNKELRAETMAAAAEREEIKLVRGPWVGPFRYEVRYFPRGTHDDIVDALAGAYQDLTSKSGKVTYW